MIAHDALCGFNGWCVLKRGHEGGCASQRPGTKPPAPPNPLPEPPPPPPAAVLAQRPARASVVAPSAPSLAEIRGVISGLSDRTSNRAHNTGVRAVLSMFEEFLREKVN